MKKFMDLYKQQPGFNQSGFPPGMRMHIQSMEPGQQHPFSMPAMLPPGGVSFPMFPPDMSEEDIQEFMQDPDNQNKIKVRLRHLTVCVVNSIPVRCDVLGHD